MPSLSPKRGSPPLENGSIAGAATTEATARVEVSIWFQHAVDAGIAAWRMSPNGESEVQFNTGEAFALTAQGITRLERPWPQEPLS
jgi:hypothetical protein